MIGTRQLPQEALGAQPDALMKEARRRRRRRWARRLVVGVAALGVAAALAALIAGRTRARTAGTATVSGALPHGAFATLRLAGPLAVAPDGVLYVTSGGRPSVEPFGDQILARQPDGRFRVIAGTGKPGFSGDGGPAVRAELSSVSDLVFAPDGTLYVADGGRVRTISPDGVIRTIAGNGHSPRTITSGTPALSAPLGTAATDGLKIALSPTGRLYISDVGQLLRLTPAGTLDDIPAIGASARGRQPLINLTSIAIDRHGNIDVAIPGWAIWQVGPNGGVARSVGFDRGSGGTFPVLQRGPGGAIYAEDGGGLVRVEPTTLVPLTGFNAAIASFDQRFLTIAFALGPNGTIYADDIPGHVAAGTDQQLVAVANRHLSMLWQSEPTPK